jgi:neutral ceramidase
MQVGGAEVCVTPPHPFPMGGYGARNGSSVGTHDELYVRCAYFKDEHGESALLTYDLVAVPEPFVQRVKERLHGDFAMDPSRVVLHATHTHSGPDVGLTFDTKSDPVMALYTEMLVLWSASACSMAIQNAKQVSLTTQTTQLSGVGGVRRTGEASSLPLRVVGFVGEDDKVNVVLITFPCHPTVMGADNRFLSADYPGACIQSVKSLLGPETVVLFLNGAAGDISTRFTRQAQTFEEVTRLGCVLGCAATSLLMSGDKQPLHQLYIAQDEVILSTQSKELQTTLQSLALAAQSALQSEKDPAKRRVYETQLQGIAFRNREDSTHQPALKSTVTAWRFDDSTGFVFWPGEPFIGYDQQLKQAVGNQVTLIGYADGMVGYIPDVTFQADTAYEVLMSLCGKSGGEQLARTSVQLFATLAAREQGGV